MGKKMRLLPSLFIKNNREEATKVGSSVWQWPSCKQHPQTHSFRGADDIFKTVNSVYFDAAGCVGGGDGGVVMMSTAATTTPESWFTNSSESASFSTVSEQESGEESLEMVIKGLRSERLFFEPGHSNSILEEAKVGSSGLPFKESSVLAMDSENPYVDFRTSMEEMVEAHGLKDWDCLEELLSWYLKANGKKNHGFILGAFVDLLVGIAATNIVDSSTTPPTTSSSSSSSSSGSCSASHCSSPEEEKIKKMSCLEISDEI